MILIVNITKLIHCDGSTFCSMSSCLPQCVMTVVPPQRSQHSHVAQRDTKTNSLTFSHTVLTQWRSRGEKNPSPGSTDYRKSVCPVRQIYNYPGRPQTDEFLLSVRKLIHRHPAAAASIYCWGFFPPRACHYTF